MRQAGMSSGRSCRGSPVWRWAITTGSRGDLTIFAADVQDLYVEELNPANPRQVKSVGRYVDMEAVKDQIRVKGRTDAVAVEHLSTAHGPVVAIDRNGTSRTR